MTANDLKATLTAQILVEEAGTVRHLRIIEALKRHEGKTITRRLNRDLEKIGARLGFRYGMIYVEFQTPGTYDVLTHLLAYDSDPTVCIAKFKEYDACHGRAAVDRNVERTASMNGLQASVEALLVFQAATRAFGEAVKKMGSESYEITTAAKKTLMDTFLWRIT